MPEATTSPTPGASTPQVQETINRNPQPDAAVVGEANDRFDSDFEYLGASGVPGVQKDGAVPAAVAPASATPAQPASHTPEENKPKFPVPPVGINSIVKEDLETKGTLADQPGNKPASAPPSGAERTYTQTEVSAIQSAKDTELQTLKTEHESVKQQLEALKNVQSALDEINRNPLAFVARYFPELASQLDSRKVVIRRLREEFGEQIDAYDPSQVLDENSPSYNIHRREMELTSEIARSQAQAEQERALAAKQREERLNTSKAQVMKEYGLTEEQFKKEVVEWGSTQQFSYLDVARLKYRDWEVQRAVAEALKQAKSDKPGTLPPSVATVGGGAAETGTPEHIKDLSDAFGDM